MGIGMAQQKGNVVLVYDENNRQIFMQSGELHGYTSGTVTVKRGNVLLMFDEKGRQTGMRSC